MREIDRELKVSFKEKIDVLEEYSEELLSEKNEWSEELNATKNEGPYERAVKEAVLEALNEMQTAKKHPDPVDYHQIC